MDLTPKPLDRETSAILAQRIRAQRRRCWRNAALAVRYLGERAQYVEGWIVVERSNPLVVEHGWCEVDGRVIDPTYTPYVSTLSEPLAYYGGFEMPPLLAFAALQRNALPVAWLQPDAWYWRAFQAAFVDSKRRQGTREPRPSTRVVNCRTEPYDVFIGRPGKWGNPFRIGADGSRDQVIEKFREWLIRRPALLRDLDSLRGRVLGCRCVPHRCHGEVLAELADLGEDLLDRRGRWT